MLNSYRINHRYRNSRSNRAKQTHPSHRLHLLFFIDAQIFSSMLVTRAATGDKAFDNYINRHSGMGGGEARCSKERTIASRFSNVTWENRSRGYQSVISHDIGERYSRNRGRDRLFMQLQRPYVSWNDTKNNARVIFDRGQKSRFTFVCI